MKTTSIFATAIATSLMLSMSASSSFAGTPHINKVEKRQFNRIEQGITSGRLNASETARVLAGQAVVHGLEALAKADGHVSHFERRVIRQAQNRTDNQIYRLKHN